MFKDDCVKMLTTVTSQMDHVPACTVGYKNELTDLKPDFLINRNLKIITEVDYSIKRFRY